MQRFWEDGIFSGKVPEGYLEQTFYMTNNCEVWRSKRLVNNTWQSRSQRQKHDDIIERALMCALCFIYINSKLCANNRREIFVLFYLCFSLLCFWENKPNRNKDKTIEIAWTPGWLWTDYVAKDYLEFIHLPSSGIIVCITMPSFHILHLLYLLIYCVCLHIYMSTKTRVWRSENILHQSVLFYHVNPEDKLTFPGLVAGALACQASYQPRYRYFMPQSPMTEIVRW